LYAGTITDTPGVSGEANASAVAACGRARTWIAMLNEAITVKTRFSAFRSRK
jgi:hypothetical protein